MPEKASGKQKWTPDASTPLPWRVLGPFDRTILADVEYATPTRQNPDKKRKLVVQVVGLEPLGACGDGDCCPQGDALELTETNAAYIVHACNHYPALYEALRELLALGEMYMRFPRQREALQRQRLELWKSGLADAAILVLVFGAAFCWWILTD